jgi:hypothetical protein
MPTTPMEQNNLAPNVITTNLMKFKPNSTLLANILHSNALELEDPPTQINVVMNVEEEAE